MLVGSTVSVPVMKKAAKQKGVEGQRFSALAVRKRGIWAEGD